MNLVCAVRSSRVSVSKFALVCIVVVCVTAASAGDFIDEPRKERRLAYLRADYARDQATVRAAYEQHAERLLWVEDRELTRQGEQLLQTLRNAGDYGLRAEDYDATKLLAHADTLRTKWRASIASWAELDAAMTIAATRFVRHLHSGRIDPRLAGFYATSPRAPLDVSGTVRALSQAAEIDPVLAVIEPPHPHYRLLKGTLQHYRQLATDDGLTDLPAFKGRSIKAGEVYVGMPALRRLLVTVGDLPGDLTADETVLDDATVAAIQRFQSRHGLEEDGALGPRTFAALRTPLSARVRQIELTLERWRWLPDFNSPPIMVNVPQFRLFAFPSAEEGTARIRQMDVIVGQEYPSSQTPIFAAELKYVVFRPYWEVPPRIAVEEVLPAIRKDLKYLMHNNMEIVTLGNTPAPLIPTPKVLDQLAAGQARLRQRPGVDNSLGLVKLMLPNRYNVYLHSTPMQRLFNEARRAFSHGCVRLSDPAGLVEHVLRDHVDGEKLPWTRDRIDAAMKDERRGADNRHVFLNKPIPVLFLYGTAMTEEDGNALFFDDVYGHDATLAEILAR